VKVTEIVQPAEGKIGELVTQLSVSAKLPAGVILLTLSDALPVFVKAIVCAALVVPNT
jgi:hypothetical protein